jgi:hypothetical protein
MSRPKTSVNRLDNLRKTFKTNSGKVLSEKQVFDAVGASYWRACIKDLKAEGMNIESIRDGRNVIGYKYVDIKGSSAKKVEVTETAETTAKVAASKPKSAKKPAKAGKANKPAKAGKTAKQTKKVYGFSKVTEANIGGIEETMSGEEDPEVLAILKQAGL